MSGRGLLRCAAAVLCLGAIVGTVAVVTLVTPAFASGSVSVSNADMFDTGYNQADSSVVSFIDSGAAGGVTPGLLSVDQSGTTPGQGFACQAGSYVVSGDITKCTVQAAPGNGDDSGVTGANGTSNTVAFEETESNGTTVTASTTITVYPAPVCGAAPDSTGSYVGTDDVMYGTGGGTPVAEACSGGASGPASTLLTGIAPGGTVFLGSNPIDAAGGINVTVMAGPGFNWTGHVGTGEVDVDTGSLGLNKQVWTDTNGSTAPPLTANLTSASTVAANFAASDPMGTCPPPQADIDAGLPFCFEELDDSAGPDVGQVALEYAGQSLPPAPTVALSQPDVPSGTTPTETITDATGACPAAIGADTDNLFVDPYHCWYGRAGDASPVTASVDGSSVTLSPTSASGDVSEADYTVGASSTVTDVQLASNTSASTTAASAGTADVGDGGFPASLVGDGVSGTDIPVGTEVTAVNATGCNAATSPPSCTSSGSSLTLSNAASASPAPETLTFYPVNLEPPQLSAQFAVPSGLSTGSHTLSVCEPTAADNGNDWEFGVQWLSPEGSLQYIPGASPQTEVCGSTTLYVTGPATTSTTPTNPSITLGQGNTDMATVSNPGVGTPTPTGSVTFYACGPTVVGPCTSTNGAEVAPASEPVTLNGAGQATSPSFTPTTAGQWCFAGYYSGDSNYSPGSDTSAADECFDVTPVTPTVTTDLANAGPVTLGDSDGDTATVTGPPGVTGPTGSVTFYACGPSVSPCNAATGSLIGSGPVGLVAGSASSASFTPDAGGQWCVVAVYGGDANDTAADDSGAPECVTVSVASAGTTTSPYSSSIVLGGADDDQAVVAGGSSGPDPTGSVTFYQCGPTVILPCTSANGTLLGPALGVGLSPGANGSATADSPPFTPTSTGTWCFAGYYSGDSNYSGSSDTNSSHECFDVTPATPTVTTSPAAAGSITFGDSDGDTATVAGPSGVPDPTGSVTFYACGPTVSPCNATTGTPVGGASNEPVSLLSGSAASPLFTPNAAGQWCFSAYYSGDANEDPSSDSGSSGECFDVTPATPTLSTGLANGGPVNLDGSDKDTATLGGPTGVTGPTGSVTFVLCAPTVSPCSETTGALADGASNEPVMLATGAATSLAFTLGSTGQWCVVAYYSGDSNYEGTDNTGSPECFTVTSPPPSTRVTTLLSDAFTSGTALSEPTGGTVTDAATISGTDVAGAGGSVTYTVYANDACTQAVPGSSSTVTVTNGSTPSSTPVSLSMSGAYYWQAAYSGDVNNAPSKSTCASETETVYGPGSLLLTGTVTDAQTTEPVVNVRIQVCTTGSGPVSCYTALTSSTGHYTVVGVPPGQYEVSAWPTGTALLQQAQGPITLTTGEVEVNFALTGPQLPPSGTAITGAYTAGGGIPGLYWGSPYTLSVTACPNGSAAFIVTAIDVNTGLPNTISGSLTESPPGSGDYVGTIPALHPVHGPGVVDVVVICPDGSTVQNSFNIYIDPSGTVVTTVGAPVAGATVELLSSDSLHGHYRKVPDGSAVMSPANRTNPSRSSASGMFGWDAIAGYYEVRASKKGCTDPSDRGRKSVTTAPFAIPPPATDLQLVLSCKTTVPTIKKFSPRRGDVGQRVVISGTDLAGATDVTFNGTGAAVVSDTATTIVTTVPLGATSGPISVTVTGGSATSAGSFTVR